MEYESHAEQSIEEPFIVCYSETSDDYMEEHQIYSNKKELQKKLCMIALKRKFQFKTLKSSTKLLSVGCVDKDASGDFVQSSWEILIYFK